MRTLLPALFMLALMPLPRAWAADAEPIGRLFSTPAQRANLDRLREKGQLSAVTDEQPAAVIAPPAPAPEPEPVPEQVTLDGVVTRSSGKTTTWLNQVPQNEQETSQGIRVRQQISKRPVVSIVLPSGKRVDLKAGQSFDGASGRVSEVYEAVPAAPTPQGK